MNYLPYEEHYQDRKAEKVALRLFYIFVYILLIFYGIMFVTDIAFNTKYRYITVEGLSMQPTLNTNPILDGDKYYQDGVYVLLTQEVDYNDIVIVSRPNDVKGKPNYTVIKRAIAFEGDKISIVKLPTGEYDMFGLPITEYRLVLQKKGEKEAKVVYEDYIKSYAEWDYIASTSYEGLRYDSDFYHDYIQKGLTTTATVTYQNKLSETVSEEVELFTIGSDSDTDDRQVFYLGDNRLGSKDSRENGTTDQSMIVGKVIYIVRDSYSLKNSAFGWFNKVKYFFVIIWNEIVDYFASLP